MANNLQKIKDLFFNRVGSTPGTKFVAEPFQDEADYIYEDLEILVPSTGTENQVLTKVINGGTGLLENQWQDIEALPEGGTLGQVVAKVQSGSDVIDGWMDIPKELPTGGTAGQVLTKGASNLSWGDKNSVIELGLNAHYDVSTNNQKVLFNNSTSAGSALTFDASDNSVLIGAGVTRVEVTASAFITAATSAGYVWAKFYKNDVDYGFGGLYDGTTVYKQAQFVSRLVPVVEGDRLTLVLDITAGFPSTVRFDGTWLNVKVIK